MLNVDAAVHRDRVMDGADDGKAHVSEFQQTPAKRLVVVADVIIIDCAAHIACHALAECVGLGETAGVVAPPFVNVDGGGKHPRAQRRHRIGIGVEIERRQFDQLHAFVDDRVGRAGDHINLMAHVGQCLGDVAHVDALAARRRIGAIARQQDTQRAVALGCVETRAGEGGAHDRRGGWCGRNGVLFHAQIITLKHLRHACRSLFFIWCRRGRATGIGPHM